jgi:anti-sigma factor RsiW
METWRLADLHAYVDDCLEPDERRAFEKSMADDPALARRAALWRAQNSAIRSAFDGEGTRAFSISIVRPQNENPGKGRRPSPVAGRPSRDQAGRSSSHGVAGASRLAKGVGATRGFRSLLSWRLGLAAFAVCLIWVWSPASPVIPATGLGDAGVAAFRAFLRPGLASVELASEDPAELQQWLTARLSRPVYLPATPVAVSLVGARIAPSDGAAAAFVVYRLERNLVGLLVQALDAPAPRAPELISADGRYAAVWAWGGQGFALVGDLDPELLLAVAADFFGTRLPGIQAAPDRGS